MNIHPGLNAAFSAAWDDCWTEVSAHPEVLRYRETHALVLLGHHLLTKLQLRGLKPYEECDVRFDDKSGLELCGRISWNLIGRRFRPDITIRMRGQDADGTGIAAELKIIRTVLERWETGDGEKSIKHNFYQELQGVTHDLSRLCEFSTVGWDPGAYTGAMCVFHVHEREFGGIPPACDEIVWHETRETDSYIVRRGLALVNAEPHPDKVKALLDETIPKVEWRK